MAIGQESEQLTKFFCVRQKAGGRRHREPLRSRSLGQPAEPVQNYTARSIALRLTKDLCGIPPMLLDSVGATSRNRTYFRFPKSAARETQAALEPRFNKTVPTRPQNASPTLVAARLRKNFSPLRA